MRKILIGVILLCHLVFIYFTFIPETLYGNYDINYFSILVLVLFILLLILFKNNKKRFNNVININLFVLIISFIFFCLHNLGETSSTNDINNYLIVDNDDIKSEVSCFPLEIDEEVIWYYYFYDTFLGEESYELSLKLKYNDDYFLKKDEIIGKYNKYVNENIIILDKNIVDGDLDFIRDGEVKVIIFNDLEKTIIFEYLSVNDKVNKLDLYYYQKELNLIVNLY